MKSLFFLISMTCLSFSAHAETQKLELIWNGAPVSPVCFSMLDPVEGNSPTQIKLSECSKNTENIKIEDNNRYALEYEEDGYDLYAINEVKGNDYLVTYIWNGGGTGHFSSGMLVSLDGDTLRLKQRIPGGDRCNGGLMSLKLDDAGDVVATRWATPADFPYMAYGDDKGIEPYKDLESSASSCIAKVTEKNDVLVSVELAEVAMTDDEWVNSYTYQRCFNKLATEQMQIKPVLNKDEYKIFMDKFFTQCVDKEKGK